MSTFTENDGATGKLNAVSEDERGRETGQSRESAGACEAGDGAQVDGGSAAATARAWIRTWRLWILLSVIFVLVVLAAFAARSTGTGGGILSPTNPAPEGAMAAAEILQQQGIQVRHTETLAATLEVLNSDAGQSSSLVLHDRLQLLVAQQLSQLAGTDVPMVLIEPSVPILEVLTEGISSAGVVPPAEGETLTPSCSLEDAVAAGPIDRGGQAYRAEQLCYLDQPDVPASGSYAQSENGSVTVVGNGQILSNDRLASAGNAALALRTLGREPLLVWYQPGLADVAVSEQPPTLADLMPPWVTLGLFWLSFTAVLAMIWKSRRLGPLVTEPLPVWAKASETVEGRARLYQDARAVERAAQNLRAAALSRLAHHFRLGRGVSAESIANTAAQRSSLPREDVARVLLQHRPTTDAELLRWARQLEALEKEVSAQ